jgi:hypothetical protein
MSATLDIIKERFPGRATLLPEEVAEVIFGNSDPTTVQGVRTNLKRGILVEGLRKRGGRWLVPVGPLAAALDGTNDATGFPSDQSRVTNRTVVMGKPTQAKRGRVPNAVRQGKIKEWSGAVLDALDEIERVRGLSQAEDTAARLGESLSQSKVTLKRTPH